MTIDGYCTIGVDREYDLTVDMLLEQMDQANVDRAVVAPLDRCVFGKPLVRVRGRCRGGTRNR